LKNLEERNRKRRVSYLNRYKVGDKLHNFIIIGQPYFQQRRGIGELRALLKCECGRIEDKVISPIKRKKDFCKCSFMNQHHNFSRTRLYRIYMHMKQRCYNSKHENYHIYGGKGIKICDEWLKSFVNFKEWSFLNYYNDKMTLDRIDSTKGYEPTNCRWVTNSQNAKNVTLERDIKIASQQEKIEYLSSLLNQHNIPF